MRCSPQKEVTLAPCAAGLKMAIADLMMMLFFAIKVLVLDRLQICR
tara:strand:- start:28 stop:165 length:138 start_codon:yes stop_codon:yes gene_type:complete